MPNLPLRQLEALLRASAEGVYASEAATELVIAHGRWLRRPDFIEACVGIERDDPGGWFAWIAWDDIGGFLEHAPFSGSEGRILRIAAELAGIDSGLPLAELLSALDDTNSRLVVAAVAHARQIDIEVAGPRPGPRSRRHWGAVPPVAGQVVGDADLGLIEQAITHPGRFTPRTTATEPIPSWRARAVLVALAERGAETGSGTDTGGHRCGGHLDRIGSGAYPFECVVCGRRYSALDLEDMSRDPDGDPDATGEDRP